MQLSYDVVCPRCTAHGLAEMVRSGVSGTYREPLARYVARRISCASCGLVRETEEPDGLEFEYWLKGEFRGHVVWARNEAHRSLLVQWLRATPARLRDYDIATRADLERLPQWMIDAKHRYEIADLLEKLRRE